MATRTTGAAGILERKRRTNGNEQALSGLLEQFMPVFAQSPDGVYLYLDDTHKVCNKRLADMFGMTIDEWRKVPNFLEGCVAPPDRELVASNYRKHVTALNRPVTFRFHGQRKNGETFLAETVMIPVSWNGNAVAYHFVREIREFGPG
ncbi:MAG: PAS domain-containing protein [Nitrospirota bacterium]